MTVGQIMTRVVTTIGMDDSVRLVRHLFDEHSFHHLLVVDRGRLVGVISDRDLLRNVSPFIDMDAHYTVRVQDDPGKVRIAITETELGKPLLVATLVADRKRLTDRILLRTLLRIPLATQKTIVAIHLHAWRMWRRGFTFRKHSEVTR